MKAKWTLWVAVVALGLTTAVVVATRAQDRPGEPPRVAAGDRPGAPDDGGMGDLEDVGDLDGLGMLMAGAMDLDAEAAQGPGGMGGPGMHGMGRGGAAREDLRKQLNLTDEQRTKLADIHDRSARAAIPIQGDLKIAGLDLRKLVRADKPDQRAIDAQIDKMAGLRAKLQKSRVASMLEARAVLTPAQQKTLRDAHTGMGGRGMRRWMQGMHGMHGDPGMGEESGT